MLGASRILELLETLEYFGSQDPREFVDQFITIVEAVCLAAVCEACGGSGIVVVQRAGAMRLIADCDACATADAVSS